MKQADMDLIPHDRVGNDLTGIVPVLVDPMDDVVRYLLDAQAAGEDVAELFHSGVIRINNSPISRSGPPGVAIHGLAG